MLQNQMRRRAFILMLVMLAAVFLLDYFNFSLIPHSIEELNGSIYDVTGLIKSVEVKENKVSFEIKVMSIDGVKVNYREKLLASVYFKDTYNDYDPAYKESETKKQLMIANREKYGDYFYKTISFRSLMNTAGRAENPGTFDYYRYLKSNGIALICTLDSYEISPEYDAGPIKESIHNYCRWLMKEKTLFLKCLNEKSQGFVSGVVFGDKGLLDDDTYELFRENGTSHVLAVSGLHIGLLYSIFRKLTGNKKSTLNFVLLVILMLSYGSLTLWSPSVSRAELMIAMRIIAEELDFRYDLLNSTGLAAVIIIIFNPYSVFSTSFQMSFLAISSVAFITPALKGKVGDIFLVSLSVFIGLMPYQAYVFNSISLTSVFANVPVIALVTIFTPAALISFLIFTFTGNIEPVNPILDLLSSLIIKVNSLTSLNGTGSLEVASPELFLVVFATISIFLFSSEYLITLKEEKNKGRIIICLALIAIVSFTSSLFYSSPLRYDDIVFVNVGQGDCIHIRNGGKNILIDGGGKYNYNIGEKKLKPYLLKNGCSSLDAAIATHLHMDHYKGIEELSECFKIGKVLTGMSAGTELKISDKVFIRTLWPESIDPVDGQDENSECSVFSVYYNGYRILVTGDLDVEGENKLLQKYQNGELKADILKVGHHGSATSTSEEFIKEVSPRYAVIQVGKNNYGHPSLETVERLESSKAEVLTNIDNGAIGFSFSRHGITCHCMY